MVRPYLIAMPALQARLEPAPPGLPIAPDHCHDPTRAASAPLLARIARLDMLHRGSSAAPPWALYDCAALPGVIAGFGVTARALPPGVRAAFDLPGGDDNLVPLSMAIATPMAIPGDWQLHRLNCQPGLEPLAASDLGARTAALLVALIPAARITATIPWQSPALTTLAPFAPLEVLAAWLPAHDPPATCVLRFDPRAPRASNLDAEPLNLGAEPLDASDPEALRRLHTGIETGRRYLLHFSPSGDPLLLAASIPRPSL